MQKLIKIGSQLLAVGFFIALMVVNIQVGFNDGISAENISATIGTEEAYAGPCGSRGCEGHEGDCGVSYTVAEIGSIEVIRHCHGSMANEEPQLSES